jgi:tRNA uridine 5-carboxymethylaminomethyl modification enzyme
MRATLEFKNCAGLYGAGQFNGSSGYEEAAVQGFIAGVNAALKVKGKPPFILCRASSYIGTLIDDLTTKGVSDPYRMLTSRSEYRLILRQDNADERLMGLGRNLGLINDFTWEKFSRKCEIKERELKRIQKVVIQPSDDLNKTLKKILEPGLKTPVKMVDLLKRPILNYEILQPFDSTSADVDSDIMDLVEIQVKYEGYIKRQQRFIDEMMRLENKKLPEGADYKKILGLRLEAVEKLEKVRPESLGQASRISGVSPADISVLMVWLKTNSK